MGKGGIIRIGAVILAFCGLGFFYFQKAFTIVKADSANPSILINEIAWMGTASSTSDEWLELYNFGGREVDLTGWTLAAADGNPEVVLVGVIPADGYFLLERTDDGSVPGVAADLIYSGVLKNSGEVLELKNEAGEIVDMIDASAGWLAGDNGKKLTMERCVDDWRNSVAAGGTPRQANSCVLISGPVCGNGVLEAGEECDDGNQVSGDGCDENCRQENESGSNTPAGSATSSLLTSTSTKETSQPEAGEATGENRPYYSFGAVVINEFVSDPADGEEEWIELYNPGAQSIDLTGWTLSEGSGTVTRPVGTLGVKGKERFLVIKNPKGYLNNRGDIIVLRAPDGSLVDQVSYGDWDDGNLENNAPAAVDPNSVARRLDGFNTFNNANDFSLTMTPTKGESNIITAEAEEASPAARAEYDYSENIFLSEFLPNPAGPDQEGEFIELFNRGRQAVDLTGWRLGDSSQYRYKIKASNNSAPVIEPGGFFLLKREQSKIALNNSGDTVKLFRPLEDMPWQEIKYKKAEEGFSYNLISTSTGIQKALLEYVWSETLTPGAANKIKKVNHPPEPDFDMPAEAAVGQPVLFDSSDTVDADGDKLFYFWNFGDRATNTLPCPEHTFLQPGIYEVVLTVSDGENKAEIKKSIKAILPKGKIKILAGSRAATKSSDNQNFLRPEVIINEIMPNPVGADTDGEWIELYNQGKVKVNLFSWRLDDEAEGSRPYFFPEEFWLSAGQFLVVGREQSGLALNNSGDAARLFNSQGELANEVNYTGPAPEGKSYARRPDGQWFWTVQASPGEENIIKAAPIAAKSSRSASRRNHRRKIRPSGFIKVDLAKVKDYEIGDWLKVKGVVAVTPGVLGARYFYILGSPGLQIYNYHRDFPSLKVGDLIQAEGELSSSYGERRLKIKEAKDIKKIGQVDLPAPLAEANENITDDLTGRLVTVKGEVVERKGSRLYLDDGTAEVLVYIRRATGIQAANFQEGEKLSITGLVNRYRYGLRVMPRSADDIVRQDPETSAAIGQVLGEVATSDEWSLPPRKNQIELFKYLFIAAGGLIVVLIVLLVKKNIS